MTSAPALLLFIASDPERSGATAEALRMGMGLAAGSRSVQVVLSGPAARVLTEEVDELVDGEMIENHLEVFAEWDTPFFVARQAIAEYGIRDAPVPVVPVDDSEIARMLARARNVMVFP
ncbi:MAG: DsrE family protein [Nitrospirota bacterium]|nr:DsrE family protein [Nitrospirota bacterium]